MRKYALCPESPEPGIADKTLVKDHDGAFGQFQGLGDAAFMGFSVGDGCQGRNSTDALTHDYAVFAEQSSDLVYQGGARFDVHDGS